MESEFLKEGILGAIIVALATVVAYLYKGKEDLHQKLTDEKDARHKEIVEVNKEVVGVMSAFTQSNNMLVDKVITVQRGERR